MRVTDSNFSIMDRTLCELIPPEPVLAKNGGKSVSKHLTDGFSCSCWRHLQIECQHGLNWNLGLSLSLRSGLSVRLSRHPVSQSFVPPVGLVLLFFTSNYCCCSNQTADELSSTDYRTLLPLKMRPVRPTTRPGLVLCTSLTQLFINTRNPS